MNSAHVARALIVNLHDASAWTDASADVHPQGAGSLANPLFQQTVICMRDRDRVRQQAGSYKSRQARIGLGLLTLRQRWNPYKTWRPAIMQPVSAAEPLCNL